LLVVSIPILIGTWLAHDAFKNHHAVKPFLDGVFGAPPSGTAVDVGDFYFYRSLKISLVLWLTVLVLTLMKMRQYAWFRVRN
jgi:hypothetical protein